MSRQSCPATMLAFIFALSFCFGCKNHQLPQTANITLQNETVAAHPKIFFPEPIHDFGMVQANTRLEHTFVFTNEGTAPLEIKKIHKTCGCIATNNGQKILQPGEASEITVAYSVGRYSGRRSKKVTVESSDPENPRIILTLTAEMPRAVAEMHKSNSNKPVSVSGGPNTGKQTHTKHVKLTIGQIAREMLSRRKTARQKDIPTKKSASPNQPPIPSPSPSKGTDIAHDLIPHVK